MIEIKVVETEEEYRLSYAIRTEVFVEEQGVAADREADEYEATAESLLVLLDGRPVGTGRWRVADGMAKLERVCLLRECRGLGIGKMIIRALEDRARQAGLSRAKLHGQTHAEAFYTGLGYQPSSGVFLEEGIEHRLMIRELDCV